MSLNLISVVIVNSYPHHCGYHNGPCDFSTYIQTCDMSPQPTIEHKVVSVWETAWGGGGGRGGILHTFCVLAIVGSVCKTVYIITFLCVGRLSCREIVDVE